MATIKDVAEAAGVSIATVSRVLSNRSNVRPELRERVLEVVKELSYRPNLVARNLRSQQSKTLGLIVSDIRNPFFTSISRAVEDAAYEQGYSVLLCNADESPEKETLYLNLMQDENVAGVIFSPTRQTIANFKNLHLEFPIVLIDRSVKGGEVDMVMLDNVSATHQLTTHLLENGYRRIAAIFDTAASTALERRKGYEEALQSYNLPVTTNLIKNVAHKLEAGYTATLDLLDASQPPDAILTANSLLCAGALTALRERNLAIPDKIALVSFDDTTWAALVQPAITVIAQPTDEIGKTATELLLQRVADSKRSARKVILQGQLVIRGSSAPRFSLVAYEDNTSLISRVKAANQG